MVDRVSREMDKAAGFCLVGVMVLVVCNVLLRKIFKQPILGAYELVGYMTALGVSLALGRCAMKNAHIALDYIQNMFPAKIRLMNKFLLNLTALAFWALSAWHLGEYAISLKASGVVSPTAQLPVYPVVLLIAVGMIGLCLVLLLKTSECGGTLLAGFSTIKQQPLPELAVYKEGR